MCPTRTQYRTYLQTGRAPVGEGIAVVGVLEHRATGPEFVSGLGTTSRLVAGDGGQPLGRKNASTGKTTITLDSYGSPLPPTRARAHSYARDLEAESGTICGNIGSIRAEPGQFQHAWFVSQEGVVAIGRNAPPRYEHDICHRRLLTPLTT
jgi:hypothetical protein